MGALFNAIRVLVMKGAYLVGQHAAERLDERGILEWQVVDGIDRGELMSERPEDEPNPTVAVRQVLADGTAVKVVWSHIISVNVAKLVTVHFFDE